MRCEMHCSWRFAYENIFSELGYESAGDPVADSKHDVYVYNTSVTSGKRGLERLNPGIKLIQFDDYLQ